MGRCTKKGEIINIMSLHKNYVCWTSNNWTIFLLMVMRATSTIVSGTFGLLLWDWWQYYWCWGSKCHPNSKFDIRGYFMTNILRVLDLWFLWKNKCWNYLANVNATSRATMFSMSLIIVMVLPLSLQVFSFLGSQNWDTWRLPLESWCYSQKNPNHDWITRQNRRTYGPEATTSPM